MEPVFENRYTGTYKMMAEFGRKYAVGPRYWTFIFLPFLLVIAAYYWTAGDDWVLGLAWTLFPLIYLLPHYYAWAAIRNDKRNNNGIVPEAVITFGDTIMIREGNIRITVEYGKILRVVRLKHSYVLMTARRTGVMLRQDGFTKGTFAEFKEFLRAKRPDLVIPE